MIPSLNSNFTFPKAFEFIIPPWTALASRQAVPPSRACQRQFLRISPRRFGSPYGFTFGGYNSTTPWSRFSGLVEVLASAFHLSPFLTLQPFPHPSSSQTT